MKCDHDGGSCWAPECASSSCEMLRLMKDAAEVRGQQQEQQIIERARQLSGQFLEREGSCGNFAFLITPRSGGMMQAPSGSLCS